MAAMLLTTSEYKILCGASLSEKCYDVVFGPIPASMVSAASRTLLRPGKTALQHDV